jgi:hypothetical protein
MLVPSSKEVNMGPQKNPKDIAHNKLREAGLWWDWFDKNIHDLRLTAVKFLLARWRLEQALEQAAQLGSTPAARIDALRKRADVYHDWMLTLRDNIETSAKSAVALEMAARIYYEEAEGLELTLLPRTDRFEHG